MHFVCFPVGCAFTRFQTLRLRSVFPQVLSDQLISYGPCQFPTLGFVVDRVREERGRGGRGGERERERGNAIFYSILQYKEIQAFVPETFYKIAVTHQTNTETVDFHWKR